MATVSRPANAVPAVASLHIHPVKSCRGQAVPAATLDHFGLCGDRRFLVVDEIGMFLTQRTLPRLALVTPVVAEGEITLAAPGEESVRVPLRVDSSAPAVSVTVWRDTVRAVDLGPIAGAWLTRYLGRPARLVAMAPDFTRPITKPTARPGDEAAFADAFPLLVISEGSLAELNGRLDSPVGMDRFRPNIVVRDCPAFAEDSWKRIRIGGIILRAAGPCGRCVVTTTDQLSLERSKEPLQTLARYRRSNDGAVNFGQNYIHETKGGILRVGDTVEVLE